MDAHDHAHHHHGPAPGTATGRIATALALIVSLMAAEVAGGLLAHSIALLSDAAHMLTDAAALALALVAARLAKRPARGQLTFGLRRAEVLSAQFNGATLLVLALFVVYGAISRLVHPPDVSGAPVLIVALGGVAINVAATWVLSGADRRSLNVEGAFQHLLTDLAAFLLTAVAGAVILATGFPPAPTASPPCSSRRSCCAPRGACCARRAVSSSRRRPRGSTSTRSATRWPAATASSRSTTSTSGRSPPAFRPLSAHVIVRPDADLHGIRAGLERLLHDDWSIDHVTLQVEHAQDGRLLVIERDL